MKTFYHVTPTVNVPSILLNGLIPQIGDRSNSLEGIPAIFLFPNKNAVENALMGWLGEQFEEYEELSLLEVSIYPYDTIHKTEGIDWEVWVTERIPPFKITLSNEVI